MRERVEMICTECGREARTLTGGLCNTCIIIQENEEAEEKRAQRGIRQKKMYECNGDEVRKRLENIKKAKKEAESRRQRENKQGNTNSKSKK